MSCFIEWLKSKFSPKVEEKKSNDLIIIEIDNNDFYNVKLTKEEIENIHNIVKQILNNKQINTMMPDFLEKKIYENLLVIIFLHIKNIVSTVKLRLLNNEISLIMKPLNEKIEKNKL